ncbi:MAG: hypothetical protein RIR00_464 [Pseudomonadota bacterium]|jgi:formate hydrogenlyase subunit 3/multisubunit Na+/H+ antiporter MnhD subunit
MSTQPLFWTTLATVCQEHIALVPGLPFLAALLLALRLLFSRRRGDAAEPLSAALARGAALAALLWLLALDLAVLLGAPPPGRVLVATWFALGDAVLSWSFLLDPRGLAAATTVALIGWLTLLFSTPYLHREAGFHRFFLAMSLFLCGMLLIVLGAGAVPVFIGWECCGLASWLLIGYNRERLQATAHALFAFLANRIGDVGFLLSLGLAYWWMGGADWQIMAQNGQLDPVTARLLLFGFVIAALAKSAQLPFSPWIARALEGPTPSSAIFYGALMIHAGVFLLARLEPVLVQVPDVMLMLVAAGGLTTLYATLCGLVQSDVKSALLYGSLGQVGLMVLAIGLGGFDLAVGYACLHALFRAWQFLRAPSYLQLLRQPAPPVAAWLGRQQWLYTGALQRFWLEHLADGLLLRPTVSLGRDMRALDENVFEPMLAAAQPLQPGETLVQGHGLAGRFLVGLAGRLGALEERLILGDGGGFLGRALQRVSGYLLTIDALIEQPRYLMLMVMATFVVIL